MSQAISSFHGQYRPSGTTGGGTGVLGDKPVMGLIAFLAPTFMWLEANVIGRIFFTELVLMGLLPFLLLVRGRMLADPAPRMFLILAFLWLSSQVLTDLIRDTPFVDYSRGWSKIAFTTMNFCALYMLIYGSRQRIVLFTVGLIVGSYLAFMINPPEFAARQPWKFGLGIPTIMLVVVLSMWRPIYRVWFLPTILIFIIGMYSMIEGSRSLAGITLAAGMYVLVHQTLGRRERAPQRLSATRTILFLVGGGLIATTLFNLYEFAAEEGALGDYAQEIYETQSQGSFGIILGGRSEIFISTQAIMDSPLIGHGSWAKNPKYAQRILELEKFGYEVNYLAADSDLIPTHSHLFGAWVEAGLIGGLFWIWVLFYCFRVLSNLYIVREPLAPLIVFVGILMLWDVLFSPFGAERRVIMPYNILLMMFAWDMLQTSVPPEMLTRIRRSRRRPPPDGMPAPSPTGAGGRPVRAYTNKGPGRYPPGPAGPARGGPNRSGPGRPMRPAGPGRPAPRGGGRMR